MNRPSALALSLTVSLGFPSLAWAQQQTDQPTQFIHVITTTVRSGAVSDYEEFTKKIAAGANKINAPQRWMTSMVSIGGPGLTYTIVIPFSKWAEYDTWVPVPEILTKAYGAAEGARILKTGRAAIERTETAVYRLLPDLSTRPKVFDPPAAFIQLLVTEVEPAMVPTWETFLSRLKAAQEKLPQAPTAIRRVAVQGAANTYVTAVPFNKFAERDSWQGIMTVLRDAYGEAEARNLNDTRLRCTRNSRLMVLAYRPDLSRPRAGAASR